MQRNKKKILITRFSAIGDVAMTIPVVYSFARQNPELEVFFMSQPFLKQLFIDPPKNLHFIEFNAKTDGKNLVSLTRFFLRLRKEKFAQIIDLHDVLRTKFLRLLFYLSRVPSYRIDKGRQEKKALTQQNKKEFRQLTTSFERYADVFRRAGYQLDIDFHSLFRNNKPDLEKITQLFGVKETSWIGIAPFAKHQGKIYPLDRMEILIGHLSDKGYKVFLFGGGKDELECFESWASKYSDIVVVGRQLKLAEELLLMSELDIMVSMDSANMHFASLVGTPVISVWGATHPYAGFLGYNQAEDNAIQTDLPCRPCSVFGNKPCLRNDYACLNQISPDRIFDKIQQLLIDKKQIL
ncbi:MAG: glycosyltransferase family 9 protein [Bacteroidales bacterium]